MRILIDLQALQTSSKYRGIGRYSLSLVREMLTLNKEHEIIILLNNYSLSDEADIKREFSDLNASIKSFSTMKNVIEVVSSHYPAILVSEEIRNWFINSLKPDFVLISSLFEGAKESFISSIPSCKDREYKVGMIGYDLIPLADKDKYLSEPSTRFWYQRKIKSVLNSDYIYTISENAKSEFKKYLKIDDNKLINISSACDTVFKKSSGSCPQLLAKFEVSKDYLLYAGTLDDRKNIKGLLKAFACLNDEIKENHQILLIGKHDELARSSLDKCAYNLGISKGTIKYSGFISTEEMANLYSSCKAFVFPSFHEGFGLPLLEAMSCGAPSICSNTSSLPEVIGDRDAMFDPNDIDDIKEKLCLILTDHDFRIKRRESGLRQAKKFSWSKTAKDILNHIEYNSKVACYKHYNYELEYKNLIKSVSGLVEKYNLQDEHIREISKCIAKNELVISHRLPENKLKWRIEGPFDSSYSLALLNRETAKALSAIGQEVALYSTEGPGDFQPNQAFLDANPDINQMYINGQHLYKQYDVISRNLYPPRVTNMQGDINLLHHYAWEESKFPYEWVLNFNAYLTGMTCVSEHVKKIMIDNGVVLPIYTSGCGVDHWNRIQASAMPFDINANNFKFLHVSSCFPRKGVDILLEAYGSAFNNEDNVSLVIKTFDNPHNDVAEQVENLKKENKDFPHVVIIKQDLTDEDLKSIYEQCDVLVSPSKAEGFGLPMAEAILSELPVITTAWGGQRDFCTPENSWLVDFDFELSDSHFKLFDSVWACPKVTDLANKLKDVYNSSLDERKSRTDLAKKYLLSNFTWENVAINLVNQTEKIKNKALPLKKYNIGWVSTWNQKCGIATYSEHLVEQNQLDSITIFAPKISSTNTADKENVHRCWMQGESDELNDLYNKIIQTSQDIVVIQMNYGFYNFSALTQLIKKLKKENIIIYLTLHSTKDPNESKKLECLVSTFKLIDRIMVHTVTDLNRLKEVGLIDNVLLLPHGILEKTPSDVCLDTNNVRYIASYGFALPHKGIDKLIEAFFQVQSKIPDVKLLLMNAEHPDPSSKAFIDKTKTLINKLNLSSKVIFNNEFLPDDVSLGYLGKAEAIFMPYQNTGESSSGAVKMAIASGVPVFVTPLKIFDDVKGAVSELKGFAVDDIVESLLSILDNTYLYDYESVERWRSSHSYKLVSDQLFNILRSLYINRD